MTERHALCVLLYRPPWRHGEPYFRAQQVAAHFRRSGDQVSVVAGPSGWCSLVRLISWPWHLARADLIFLYPQPFLPFFALTAKWFGRCVVIDHFVSYVRMGNVSPRAGRWLASLEKAAYRQADAVLAHTESIARSLQTAYTLVDGKVHTIYCLVDTDRFSPSYRDEARHLRHKLGLDEHFVVLYHGMWHPWHGLDTLRTAVHQLAETNEPVALVLVGRAGEGAGHERLLDEVPFKKLPFYIHMADVWCSGFTSLSRGDRTFSSTMIQALAMARPVITSPSPEKSRLLDDGENVFFVPPDDPDALAAKLRYCRLHPDIAHCVGEAARRLVQQEFDVAMFGRLLDRFARSWFSR